MRRIRGIVGAPQMGARYLAASAIALLICAFTPTRLAAQPVPTAPTPLLDATHPVQWLFVYKFNSSTFSTRGKVTECIFGGKPDSGPASQAYAVASSSSSGLADGAGLIGTSLNDPVGATFNSIFNSDLNFVVWNDQFLGDPDLCGSCDRRWGHSKGILAWDNAGNGVVLQVSTPDWPGAGSTATPRQHEGNTLGCEHETDNVQYAQHFFALKLTPHDTGQVLDALYNASVVTKPGNPQVTRIGGPADLVAKASRLGQRIQSVDFLDVTLSSGVRLISKASDLWVPPWQLISARLGVPMRTATWWGYPAIPETTDRTAVTCWRPSLGKPKAVKIAKTGAWGDRTFNVSLSGSHAKLGVSLDATKPFTIFGDMNQQGALGGTNCHRSQNGRGGLFFILSGQRLHDDVASLIGSGTAITHNSNGGGE